MQSTGDSEGMRPKLEGLEIPSSSEEFTSKFATEFKVTKLLGQGAYGCVFEADKLLLGDITWKSAVKRIPLQDRDVNTSLREVKALLSFSHVGIVRFNDAWKEEPPKGWQIEQDSRMYDELESQRSLKHRNNGSGDYWFNDSRFMPYRDGCAFLYIQMELCNSTLAKWLARNQYRDLARMKHWFKQIVSAVDYIHDMKYIHRDLKPTNILFAGDESLNRLKICDLGIITADSVIKKEEDADDDANMRTDNMGTRMYMAPEQASWFYNSKVDIYSLGLILAELCVSMTEDEAFKNFLNYQRGKVVALQHALHHLPEVEKFVSWLTNIKETERPDCKEILEHSFLKPFETVKEFRSEFLTTFDPVRVIGDGGFGCIFEAKHYADLCTYAVKRIPVKPRSLDKGLIEPRIFASLRHEGILGYHTLWTEEPPNEWQYDADYKILGKIQANTKENTGERFLLNYKPDSVFIYIQMELCKSSLGEWLSNQSTRELTKAKELFKQMVSAVAFLHKKQLFHRNLKPHVFHLDDNGRLKLNVLPLVTAQIINDGQEIDGMHVPGVGTIPYMAPEQLSLLGQYTSKVDIFALGLILIELCAKLTPAESIEVFDGIRSGKRSIVLEEQPEVEKFVSWLTNVDYNKRPTCEEILKHDFLAQN